MFLALDQFSKVRVAHCFHASFLSVWENAQFSASSKRTICL